jgi:threonine/homoserine/homoserine lactone efflux protein
MAEASLTALALDGLLLGWSVAWPPGPINAEIARRGLAQGFWRAYSVGLGASTGDALWAVAVGLGAGALAASVEALAALSAVSTILLLLLAGIYLRGAVRSLAAWRRGDATERPARLESGRAGYLLGLGLALSSPWNIAFWLAVIGRAETLQAGPAAALVVACAVLVGTNLWVLLLCAAVVRLRARFAGAGWDGVAKGATGLLLLAFALEGLWRSAG